MTKLIWSSVALSLLIGVSAAVADGGGGGGMGGGGGGMPSVETPQYDPAVEYGKGLTALEAKDFKGAARFFANATAAAPKNDDAWRMLGVAQSSAANWRGARTAFQRAVKIAPNDMVSHAGLGVAMARLKDKKAQEELDWLKAQSAACGAGCPDAARLGALTAQLEGVIANPAAPQAALEVPKPVASLGDASYLQAVGLINEKRYDEALAALDKASNVFGPHPDIMTYEGYVWRKKGDLGRAKNFYEQALAIAPDHRGATEYYGELKVAVGDTAGARQMLARLERICTFGCAQAEELRKWIDHGGDPQQR